MWVVILSLRMCWCCAFLSKLKSTTRITCCTSLTPKWHVTNEKSNLRLSPAHIHFSGWSPTIVCTNSISSVLRRFASSTHDGRSLKTQTNFLTFFFHQAHQQCCQHTTAQLLRVINVSSQFTHRIQISDSALTFTFSMLASSPRDVLRAVWSWMSLILLLLFIWREDSIPLAWWRLRWGKTCSLSLFIIFNLVLCFYYHNFTDF